MSFLGLHQQAASRLAGVIGFTYVWSVRVLTFDDGHDCSVLGDRGSRAVDQKLMRVSYAFQTAFAAFAVPAQSDRFYDLAGSLGFISSTLLSLVRRFWSLSTHDIT